MFLTGGDDGNDAVVGYNYNDSDDGSEEDDEVDDGDGGGDDIDDKDGGDDAENDDRLFLSVCFWPTTTLEILSIWEQTVRLTSTDNPVPEYQEFCPHPHLDIVGQVGKKESLTWGMVWG